jgi:hypothetical protein
MNKQNKSGNKKGPNANNSNENDDDSYESMVKSNDNFDDDDDEMGDDEENGDFDEGDEDEIENDEKLTNKMKNNKQANEMFESIQAKKEIDSTNEYNLSSLPSQPSVQQRNAEISVLDSTANSTTYTNEETSSSASASSSSIFMTPSSIASSNELTASLNQTDLNFQQQHNCQYSDATKLEVSIKTEKMLPHNHQVDALLSTSLSSSNTSTSSSLSSSSYSYSSKSNSMSPHLTNKDQATSHQQQNWSVNSAGYQNNQQYSYVPSQNELFRHSIPNYPPNISYSNSTNLFSNFNMMQPLSSSSPATLAAASSSTATASSCDPHQHVSTGSSYTEGYPIYNQFNYQNPSGYHQHHSHTHPSPFMNASINANTTPNGNMQFNYSNMYGNGNLIQPSSHSWNTN